MMKRLVVYSHDTFGLGNIRRMLCICEHLLATIPDLSILLISGSPMIHSFRLSPRLDYIKLPCLRRTEHGTYAVKSMGTPVEETVQLRADVIRTTLANFKPDVLLVDKKPYGVEDELRDALLYLQRYRPETRKILLLRDILDSVGVTIKVWEKRGYYDVIQALYDLVLVVGTPEIFDVCAEYRFPPLVADKVEYCGYIRRLPGRKNPAAVRQELQLHGEQLIVVTPGGGEDGYQLLATYLDGLAWLPAERKVVSLIVCGPEMPQAQRTMLAQAARRLPHVRLTEFTDDLPSYMGAADAVVSMAGYNTVCEILSLNRPAVVVPRVMPVAEQWLRAERMARLGLFYTIHPHDLTPQSLMQTVMIALRTPRGEPHPGVFDLNALPRIAGHIAASLGRDMAPAIPGYARPAYHGQRYAHYEA